MFLIDTSRNGRPVYDAQVNQSIDAYLLERRPFTGHGLLCYINDPAVIIGRLQNAYGEVDLAYLKQHRIQLVRRTSGGGAVYHDQGNLVFENIVIGDPAGFRDYQAIGAPIAAALRKLGVASATVRDRDDIAVADKKVSGMAMVKHRDAYAAGGTLLFDLDEHTARQALTPASGLKIERGIKSADVPITNLKPFLPATYQDWTITDLRQYLLCQLFGVDRLEEIPTYHLTKEDWAAIDDRLASRYGTAAWNLGKNPGFRHFASRQTAAGTLYVNYNLDGDRLTAVQFFADFLPLAALEPLGAALVGKPLEAPTIAAAARPVLPAGVAAQTVAALLTSK